MYGWVIHGVLFFHFAVLVSQCFAVSWFSNARNKRLFREGRALLEDLQQEHSMVWIYGKMMKILIVMRTMTPLVARMTCIHHFSVIFLSIPIHDNDINLYHYFCWLKCCGLHLLL